MRGAAAAVVPPATFFTPRHGTGPAVGLASTNGSNVDQGWVHWTAAVDRGDVIPLLSSVAKMQTPPATKYTGSLQLMSVVIVCSFSGRGVVPFTPSLRHERPKLKRRALDEPEGGTGAATAAAPRVESTTHSSNWRLIMKLAEIALWGRQRRPPRGRQR